MQQQTDEKGLVAAFRDQWSLTLELLRRSIDCFDDAQWEAGVSEFEVPWKVAYHTIQCLANYFRREPEKPFREIPFRFSKDWSQLGDSEAPSKSAVLEYLQEMAAHIDAYLAGLSDDDLSREFPQHGTVAGNLLYAMRHTMHHQGGLNVLSVYHEIDIDLWDGG